jgi:hypothetical protein
LSKNKIIKSVSFNITNEKDQEYLKRIENINFSGYVKGLIKADLIKQEAELKIVHKSKGGGIKIIIGEK